MEYGKEVTAIAELLGRNPESDICAKIPQPPRKPSSPRGTVNAEVKTDHDRAMELYDQAMELHDQARKTFAGTIAWEFELQCGLLKFGRRIGLLVVEKLLDKPEILLGFFQLLWEKSQTCPACRGFKNGSICPFCQGKGTLWATVATKYHPEKEERLRTLVMAWDKAVSYLPGRPTDIHAFMAQFGWVSPPQKDKEKESDEEKVERERLQGVTIGLLNELYNCAPRPCDRTHDF